MLRSSYDNKSKTRPKKISKKSTTLPSLTELQDPRLYWGIQVDEATVNQGRKPGQKIKSGRTYYLPITQSNPFANGAYGQVYKLSFKVYVGGSHVCLTNHVMKMVDSPTTTTTTKKEEIEKEVKMLRQQSHMKKDEKTIVSESNIYLIPGLKHYYILMPFVLEMTLENYVNDIHQYDRQNKVSKKSKANRDFVIWQLLVELEKLHRLGIVHRDLKPENTMISTTTHNLRFIDFGLAMYTHTPNKGCSGTPKYMSPEVVRGRGATQNSDSYTLAILASELLNYRADVIIDADKPGATWDDISDKIKHQDRDFQPISNYC